MDNQEEVLVTGGNILLRLDNSFLVGKKERYKEDGKLDFISWDAFGGKYCIEDKTIVDMCFRECDEETLKFMTKEEKIKLKAQLEKIYNKWYNKEGQAEGEFFYVSNTKK
jgi:hypothetical protein